MKRCLLALALVLVSCGTPTATTPPGPNSPQTMVLNADKALADAINAAVKTAITLRDQGKLTQSDVVLVEGWARSAALLDERIATELGSADAWTFQKSKILQMLPGLSIPPISGLNPTLAASLAAVQTLISQIQGQVTQ